LTHRLTLYRKWRQIISARALSGRLQRCGRNGGDVKRKGSAALSTNCGVRRLDRDRDGVPCEKIRPGG